MNFRKALASLLAVSLAATQLTAGSATQTVHVVQTFAADAAAVHDTEGYFCQQLSAESKVFYDAINTMYTTGMLKTGTESFDLTANGLLTQEEAAGYADGGPGVLTAFGAARDAFYMDHMDTFYVDLSALSIRVTTGEDGYHVYLGAFRRDNYYAEGFTSAADVESALGQYHEAVAEIAAAAKAAPVEEGKDAAAEQVRYVHDYITHHTSYRLEDACDPANIGFIRNAYGPLLREEGVCEGYSRAFKAVLDELGIPCVLVSGVYNVTENQPELHMWTLVQINGGWYGVDPTMDDPITQNPSEGGVDGGENEEYLLVGEDILNRHHTPSNILSEANYPFTYPDPEINALGVETLTDSGGLVVNYKADSEMEGVPAGDFIVSYNGMGYAKAAEQGKYIIVRFINYYEENDETVDSGWCYIEPQYYPGIEDTDTELTLTLASAQNVQFAVTDIPPTMNEYGIPDLVFDEEPVMLEQSNVIHNENGYYMPAPYARNLTPRNSGYLVIERGTQHVSATFDEVLVPIEGEEFEVVMTCSSPSGQVNSTMTKAQWDGVSTISFDFTPSKMWADDRAAYTFSIKGLKSARSGKAPMDITYEAKFQSYVCAYRSQGIQWNVFAQPRLLDNSDISMNDWKTTDGSTVSDKLRDRMVLVASAPSHKEQDQMAELVDTQTEDTVLESKSFEISLSICKAQVASTGDGVRVMLGFPDGYGPEDAGVTFKVYHFIKDAAGNCTGVEEIPCVITEYGLVVTCMSFSPYMVAAVEDDGTESAAKSVVASASKGGSVSCDGIVTLAEGESVTVFLQPDEGYVIDSVSVGGKLTEITDASGMPLTLSYADIDGNSSIVDVKFAPAAVAEAEAAKGETPIPVDAEAEAAPAGNLVAAPDKPGETTPPATEPAETTTEAPATTAAATTLPETTAVVTTSSTAATTTTVTTTTTTTTTTAATTTTTAATTTTTAPTTTTTPSVETIPGTPGKTASKVLLPPEDGLTDMYLLYAVDSLNYSRAGLTIAADGKTYAWETNTVYQSVIIGDKTYTAEEFGGKYLLALGVTGIPADAARTAAAIPRLTELKKETAELPKKTYKLPEAQKEEIV